MGHKETFKPIFKEGDQAIYQGKPAQIVSVSYVDAGGFGGSPPLSSLVNKDARYPHNNFQCNIICTETGEEVKEVPQTELEKIAEKQEGVSQPR